MLLNVCFTSINKSIRLTEYLLKISGNTSFVMRFM